MVTRLDGFKKAAGEVFVTIAVIALLLLPVVAVAGLLRLLLLLFGL